MRKFLFVTILFLFNLSVNAQTDSIPLNENGAYERKEVIQVDGATASTLFDRAMIALTEWTGADGKSKVGIDYQNQESHIVVYKGTYYLGFKKTMLRAGWDRYANFSLKVRCKDGKAQIIVTVDGITGIYNTNGVTKYYPMREILDITNDSKGKKKKRREEFVNDITSGANNIVSAMCEKLKSTNNNDDF